VSSTYYISQPSAVLRFTGEDHFDFLQGQGTADLRGPVGICHYCLWLDFKGRILADSFLLKESEEAVLLVSYLSTAEKLRQKFERHIIADDVEIEDLTDQYQLVSFPDGESAAPILAQFKLSIPEEGVFTSEGDNHYCFHGRRLGRDSLDLLVPAGAEIVDARAGMTVEEAEAWRLRDGIPLIPVDCEEASVNPLELNILSALSFDKGCYLGQEVVARVHRLGRTTRRMVRIESVGDTSEPLPNEMVLQDDQVIRLSSVGQVDDLQVGLALLKRKIEDGPILINDCSFVICSVPEN
jgi:folate-binding protein YgfZ